MFEVFCKEKIASTDKSEGLELVKTKYKSLVIKTVNVKMDWLEFQKRVKRNADFMSVPIKERESLFKEYFQEFKELQIKNKEIEIEKSKIAFKDWLVSMKKIHQESEWKDFKKSLDSNDSRYKALSSHDRQFIFEELKNEIN